MSNSISKFDFGLNSRAADFRTKDICNVCGQTMPNNVGMSVDGGAAVQNYCRVCGMEAEAGMKFCCGDCETKFKKTLRGGRLNSGNCEEVNMNTRTARSMRVMRRAHRGV